KTVRIWDARSGEQALALPVRGANPCSVVFSHDGRRLASGNEKGGLVLWDAATGQELLNWQGDQRPIRGLAFSADGQRLVSSDQEGAVKVWDALTGRVLPAPHMDLSHFPHVAFDRAGQRLAAVRENTVEVWDLETGQQRLTLGGHTDRVLTVVFS